MRLSFITPHRLHSWAVGVHIRRHALGGCGQELGHHHADLVDALHCLPQQDGDVCNFEFVC